MKRTDNSQAGIPKETQNRILEPSFTTDAVGEGTELGLDIARRIFLRRHRGDIGVHSRLGETSFRVRLPLEPRQSNGG